MKKISKKKSKLLKFSLGLGTLSTIGIIGPIGVAYGESESGVESESKKVKKQLENLVTSNFNFDSGTWNLNADANTLLQSVDVSVQYSINGGILWSKTNPIVHSQYTPVLAKLANNDLNNPIAEFDTPDAWLTLNLPQVNLEDKLAQENFLLQGLEKEGNIDSVFTSEDWTYMIQVNGGPVVELNEVNNLKTGDELTISIVINKSINKENVEKFAVPEPVTFRVEAGLLLKKSIQDKLNFNNFLIQGKENQGFISSISSSEDWVYMIQVNGSPAVKLSEVNNLKTGDELTVFIQASDEFWKEYSIPEPVTFRVEAGVLLKKSIQDKLNFNNFLIQGKENQGTISSISSSEDWVYMIQVNGSPAVKLSEVNNLKTGDELTVFIQASDEFWKEYSIPEPVTFRVEAGVLMPEAAPDNSVEINEHNYLYKSNFQFNNDVGQGKISAINSENYFDYLVSVNGQEPQIISDIANIKTGDTLKITILPKYKNVTLSGTKSDLTFQVESQMSLYSSNYLSPEIFQFNGLNGQGTMSVEIDYAKYVKYLVSINGETPVYIEEVNNLKNGDQLQIYLEAVAPYSLTDPESHQRIEVQELPGEALNAEVLLAESNFFVIDNQTISESVHFFVFYKYFTYMVELNGETKSSWNTVVEGGDRIKIFIKETSVATAEGITLYNKEAFVEFIVFINPISNKWELLKLNIDK